MLKFFDDLEVGDKVGLQVGMSRYDASVFDTVSREGSRQIVKLIVASNGICFVNLNRKQYKALSRDITKL